MAEDPRKGEAAPDQGQRSVTERMLQVILSNRALIESDGAPWIQVDRPADVLFAVNEAGLRRQKLVEIRTGPDFDTGGVKLWLRFESGGG